jgi:hypothetical protein
MPAVMLSRCRTVTVRFTGIGIPREMLGQQLRNPLIQLQLALCDRDADQRADDALGCGLDVHRALARVTAVIALPDQLPVARNQQTGQR